MILNSTYFSRNELLFYNVVKYQITEKADVPRYSIKSADTIAGIKVNKPLEYSDDLIKKAIEYGMVLLISYKGAEDASSAGHERTIYPMVLGTNDKGSKLLRGFHLKGFSVSKRLPIDKEWRMFRTDRISSVTFTGMFFRLAPEGYNAKDSAMTAKIIASADFNTIRANQENLVKKGEISNSTDDAVGNSKLVYVIKAEETEGTLNVKEPFESGYFNSSEAHDVRITFVKSLLGAKRYVVIGALGDKGSTVKITTTSGNLGVFKVVDSMTADKLQARPNIGGYSAWPIILYQGKK
jgi:hypothetical protein